MAVVMYKGITLPYPIFTRFNQEVVYDDSNTDKMLTRFDIQLQFICDVDYLENLVWPLGDESGRGFTNPAQIMQYVRNELLTPRCKLSVFANGVDLIPNCRQPNGQLLPSDNGATAGTEKQVDAANGPHPQRCDITELSETSFLVSYHIIAHYVENISVGRPLAAPNNRLIVVRNDRASNNVLTNKWSETVEIDKHNFTRRTREGKYVIRSDNEAGAVIDLFRETMAQLGVPRGFLRESSRYTVDPTGLALQYQMVDQEQFKMPPDPATEADGFYLESTTNNGAIRWGEVQVTLKGPKGAGQPRMIDRAIAIAASKLIVNGAALQAGNQGGSFARLDSSAIKIGLYHNTVEVAMRAMMRPRSRARFSGVGGVAGAIAALPMGQDFGAELANAAAGAGAPGADPAAQAQAAAIQMFGAMTHTPFTDVQNQIPPNYPLRGTAGLLLRAAYYWDPTIPGMRVDPTTGNIEPGSTGVGTGRLNPGGL
jgi:hypothetical protein